MNQPQWIHEATPENFEALVLENSARGPVLLNFWAPWAGPCMKLWPVLEGLAGAYGGRFLLVNLNTDTHKRLAQQLGVNSLPTVRVYRNRKVVEEVRGAESETSLRRLIDRHVARKSDALLAAAVKKWTEDDRTGALALIEQAAQEEPDSPRVPLTHAKLLVRAGELDAAQALLEALPVPMQDDPGIRALRPHLEFLLAARDAPAPEALERTLAREPDNADARFQLGAVRATRDDYAGAMEALIELVRRNPDYRAGIGRRGLTALFELLGDDHDLVRRYRAALLDALP